MLVTLVLTFAFKVVFGAGMSIDPAPILEEIKERGAQLVFNELWKNGAYGKVLKGIESGDDLWLDVAVEIQPATDAGPSEMLDLAAGVALVKAPAEVLLRAVPALSIEGVCGFPDMSDPRYDTKEKTLSYLDERIRAVTLLRQPSVKVAQEKCLKILKEKKSEILSPTGPFSSNSGSNTALHLTAIPLRFITASGLAH